MHTVFRFSPTHDGAIHANSPRPNSGTDSTWPKERIFSETAQPAPLASTSGGTQNIKA